MIRTIQVTLRCVCVAGGLWLTSCNNQPKKIDSVPVAQSAKTDTVVNAVTPDTSYNGCLKVLRHYYEAIDKADTAYRHSCTDVTVSHEQDSIRIFYLVTTYWSEPDSSGDQDWSEALQKTIYAQRSYSAPAHCEMVLDNKTAVARVAQLKPEKEEIYFTVIAENDKLDWDGGEEVINCNQSPVELFDRVQGTPIETLFKGNIPLKATGVLCDQGTDHYGTYWVQVLYKTQILWAMHMHYGSQRADMDMAKVYKMPGPGLRSHHTYYLVSKKQYALLQLKKKSARFGNQFAEAGEE